MALLAVAPGSTQEPCWEGVFCSSMVSGPFFSEPELGVFFPQVESHEVGISLEGRHCEGEQNTAGIFHNG